MRSGDRVKAVRERTGLSQRDLATASDVPQATLSRIESGTRTAKMPELLALARALGVPLSELSEHSEVRDRLVCMARTSGTGTPVEGTALHAQMVHFFEVSAYLDEQGIPAR